MAAANLAELPDWARELLAEARVGHLSYVDDRDRPRVLPVTFALVDGVVWTAVDQKPRRRRGGEVARVRYLRRRPQAALCVDHYEDDWSRLAWVQAVGAVEIVEADGAGSAVQPALAELCAKYEQYVDSPPGGPFLALRPQRTLAWRAAGR